jgi:hypothetical protein
MRPYQRTDNGPRLNATGSICEKTQYPSCCISVSVKRKAAFCDESRRGTRFDVNQLRLMTGTQQTTQALFFQIAGEQTAQHMGIVMFEPLGQQAAQLAQP